MKSSPMCRCWLLFFCIHNCNSYPCISAISCLPIRMQKRVFKCPASTYMNTDIVFEDRSSHLSEPIFDPITILNENEMWDPEERRKKKMTNRSVDCFVDHPDLKFCLLHMRSSHPSHTNIVSAGQCGNIIHNHFIYSFAFNRNILNWNPCIRRPHSVLSLDEVQKCTDSEVNAQTSRYCILGL